jgi:DNA-binding SARP family transcriptional activator
LRVALLGPVEVSCQGIEVALSPLELNLLILLALSPDVAVSTERLIDHLWGFDLPSSPRSRIQALVSGLRRKIGDLILTRHPGYLIAADRLERDLDEVERLVALAGRCTVPDERLQLLREAQELWRGDPLEGVSTPAVVPERARLVEQRLSLLEARCDAELAVGNHRGLTGLLAPAVAENPFREQLACLYITALYRSNRQADALAVYHQLRERLADELGSDVCPELRDLYVQILQGKGLFHEVDRSADAGEQGGEQRPYAEPAPAPPTNAPTHLPPRDGLFLGREAELRALTEAFSETLADDVVVVVSGPGGLGKTALVTEWAHQVIDQYPDGQLFFELEAGDTTGAVALGSALTALGLAAADVPTGLIDRIGLYRTMIRDRRLLIVADDASSAEQVLALIPSSRKCTLVVTARPRLVSLAAHHVLREILLPPLTAERSRELLSRVVGFERLADPAGSSLVAWCGGWPLLIRHVGAMLAFRPSQPLAEFLQELQAGTPDGVLHGDTRSVEEALASAYAGLSPAAAALFERIALRGGSCCLHVAATAAGTTDRGVRRLLDELVGIQFLVESRTGEFRCHDVIARFGYRLALGHEWASLSVMESVSAEGAADCGSCGVASSQESVPAPRRGR